MDLKLPSGECLGLVGANGSGKTTLLRCILATTSLDTGTVTWRDHEVKVGSPTPGVVGMLEEPRLFGRLSAVDNLVAALADGVNLVDCRQALARVGLGDVGSLPVGRFSQGMRQRLGLARLLVKPKELIVLDEPSNGLDPVGIRWLRNLIGELRASGATVIVSSHALYEVQQVMTQFLLLGDGKVLAQGSREELGEVVTLEDLYFRALGEGSS
ncbi:ABC transporter ATP-binding protein [Knoellia remsis]|nr:ATP-binding cassette domain-containing protein [Knoellia remsis]